MCFQVNDELCKILDDVEHPEKRAVSNTNNVSVAAASGSNSADNTDAALDSLDFDAFGFEDRKKSVAGDDISQKPAAPATSKIASSALEDLLAPPSSPPAAAVSASPSKDNSENKSEKKNSDGDDGEFDDFFGSRQVSNNSFSIDE